MSLVADYYDGRSARRHVVSLALVRRGGAVFVQIAGDGVERRAAIGELRVSEPMGAAPRLVSFPDGAYCEIRDHQGFQALLAETGFSDHFVVRWQFSWRWIGASAALCVALLWLAYHLALPYLAERIAAEMPASILESVSASLLENLDQRVWAPSRLPVGRQAALVSRFSALRLPDPPVGERRLAFRAGRAMGANAIALPSGLIVLSDELVALADNDDELMGVLAHELGHIQARHGMRQILQSAAVGMLTAWFVGDISSMLAGVPAALLEAGYSRDFEREADVFAARMLADNGISPRCLADILQRLAPAGKEAGTDGGSRGGYLSTHPATGDRLAEFSGPPCR